MAKRVTRDVFATNPETGESKWLHPGDFVEDGFEVTNPKAFAPVEGADEEEDDFESLDDPAGTPYQRMKKAELVSMCESRGLHVSGTVDDLIARLEEDDAASS